MLLYQELFFGIFNCHHLLTLYALNGMGVRLCVGGLGDPLLLYLYCTLTSSQIYFDSIPSSFCHNMNMK